MLAYGDVGWVYVLQVKVRKAEVESGDALGDVCWRMLTYADVCWVYVLQVKVRKAEVESGDALGDDFVPDEPGTKLRVRRY